jgi:phosphonate transport system substrate-binding protein
VRFATFLSPALGFFYDATTRHIGRELGIETELVTGDDYGGFASGEYDAGFICGLPYVRLSDVVDAVAAPVVGDPRYEDRPVYFSDVIVADDHPAASFRDLRGASWCYNEPNSHSGYLTVLNHLASIGESPAFFGRFDAVGFHTRSIELVRDGVYDASAIDSHVLAITKPDGLRVIETIGPSPIQPLVVRKDLGLRTEIADALASMPTGLLQQALVARWAPVSDADYEPIRAMTCRFLPS